MDGTMQYDAIPGHPTITEKREGKGREAWLDGRFFGYVCAKCSILTSRMEVVEAQKVLAVVREH